MKHNLLLNLSSLFFSSPHEFETLLTKMSYESFLTDRLNIKAAELNQVRTANSNRGINRIELETLLNNAGCGEIVFNCGNIIFPPDDQFPVCFDAATKERKLRIIIEMMFAGLPATDIRRFVILAESLDWHSPVNLRTVYRKRNFLFKSTVAGALIGALSGACSYWQAVVFPPTVIILSAAVGALSGLFVRLWREKKLDSARETKLANFCLEKLQYPIDFYIKFRDNDRKGGKCGKALSFDRLDTEKL